MANNVNITPKVNKITVTEKKNTINLNVSTARFQIGLVSYTYEKQVASTVWNISHNLHFKPNVIVMDYGSNQVECDIEYVDLDTVTLTFSQAMSGYAYLS
jgi:hypothetical protein